MSGARSISTENIAKSKNFSIDVVVENQYTHYVQISNTASGAVLQTLPFDPTDRTLAAVISHDCLKLLGDEAESVLKLLSEKLLETIGAKQFILVPTEATLPNYTAPEASGFSRFRHGDRQAFIKSTASILEKNKKLTAELDAKYSFVSGEKSLLASRNPIERYQEINNILEKSRFLDTKMTEYKEEELQGKMSRFKSECIKPFAMLDKEGNIVGMVRALLMGNGFAYLADEVMNQEMISLDNFTGSDEEKKKQREVFLLAYLINKVSQLELLDQQHFFIIAASGREKMYDEIGCQEFPLALQGWKAMMKFGKPGSVLVNKQEDIKKLSLPKQTLLEAGTSGVAAEQKTDTNDLAAGNVKNAVVAVPVSTAKMISAARRYANPIIVAEAATAEVNQAATVTQKPMFVQTYD